jgi:hypothetical protein
MVNAGRQYIALLLQELPRQPPPAANDAQYRGRVGACTPFKNHEVRRHNANADVQAQLGPWVTRTREGLQSSVEPIKGAKIFSYGRRSTSAGEVGRSFIHIAVR